MLHLISPKSQKVPENKLNPERLTEFLNKILHSSLLSEQNISNQNLSCLGVPGVGLENIQRSLASLTVL